MLRMCLFCFAVLVASTAEAGFSFTLVPSTAQVLIGGSTSLNVVATTTAPDPSPYIFSLSSVSLTTTGAPNITFTTSLSAGPIYVGTTTGNVIGTITATASPTSPSGSIGTVVFNGTVVNPFGVPDGSVGPFSSNQATITAVPEPSTFGLVGLCAFGFAAFRRGRSRS
jgi:PEP-CTERM motif